MSDPLDILQSLALSQGIPVRTELNKKQLKRVKNHLYSAHLMDPLGIPNYDGWIYVPPKDKKSRYLVPYIAHELGHFVDNRSMSKEQDRVLTISLIIREELGISNKFIIASEKRAWMYGRYLLNSLGLLTKEERAKFNIAKKHCLNGYLGKDYNPDDSKWK